MEATEQINMILEKQSLLKLALCNLLWLLKNEVKAAVLRFADQEYLADLDNKIKLANSLYSSCKNEKGRLLNSSEENLRLIKSESGRFEFIQ